VVKDSGLSSQRPGFEPRPEQNPSENEKRQEAGKKMEMNIYKNRMYLVFTAIAVLLIAFSLLNFSNIKYGVEFNGGTLVIVDTSQQVDTSLIESRLLQSGFSEVSIQHYETPYGYRLEIEVPNTENIEYIEDEKDKISGLVENLSLKMAQEKDYSAEQQEIFKILDKSENISGIPYNKTVSNPREYLDQFNAMYDKVRSDYENGIKDSLTSQMSVDSFSFQTVTPTLSIAMIGKATQAALMSAIFSIVLIFILFRNIGPSVAVLSGAAADVTISVGLMAFFQIPMTLASFSALMSLVGYSLDTDILLTTNILKKGRDETAEESAWKAMHSGVLMTFSGILSFGVLFYISWLLKIPVYSQISSTVLLGLVGDLFATWGINAVLLLKLFGGKPQ
jgi:preprotein translocase subunit SecF